MTSVNSHSDRTVVDGFCGPAARHRHRGMSGHAGHRVGDIPTPTMASPITWHVDLAHHTDTGEAGNAIRC